MDEYTRQEMEEIVWGEGLGYWIREGWLNTERVVPELRYAFDSVVSSFYTFKQALEDANLLAENYLHRTE